MHFLRIRKQQEIWDSILPRLLGSEESLDGQKACPDNGFKLEDHTSTWGVNSGGHLFWYLGASQCESMD